MKDVNILKNNGVNVEKSLEIFVDMEMYDESLGDFLGEIGTKLEKIKNFKEASDMPNYAILAHSLKSDAKYFGFENLAEMAYNHELKSKENNIAYVFDNYDSLITETERMVDIVRRYLGEEPVLEFEPIVINDNHQNTILVVDDSTIVRNFIQKIFADNLKVLIATDGAEAIEQIKNNNDINAMFLDLNMPNVDGFEVLEYFKANNLFKTIPVSIITGNDSSEVDKKAFNYPIVDILKKPFNERDVKNVVERTIMYGNGEF